jgi:hypothetical protein
MGKDDDTSTNSEEEEEDSEEEKIYKISSIENPKKFSKKFDFKGTGGWITVCGQKLNKGKHKIKIKFEQINWGGNFITGIILFY